MEVAKCSPDLTVQSSVRDPEVTGEAVKLRVTSQPGPVLQYNANLSLQGSCLGGIILKDLRFRDLEDKGAGFVDILGGWSLWEVPSSRRSE